MGKSETSRRRPVIEEARATIALPLGLTILENQCFTLLLVMHLGFGNARRVALPV